MTVQEKSGMVLGDQGYEGYYASKDGSEPYYAVDPEAQHGYGYDLIGQVALHRVGYGEVGDSEYPGYDVPGYYANA